MTADQWQYLALMGLCLAVTLPLELVLGARVYRRPRRAARAIVPALVVFAAWDWIAIGRQHWWFEARYVTGLAVGRLPIEEIAFFLVVPLCALLTFEAVQRVAGRLRRA